MPGKACPDCGQVTERERAPGACNARCARIRAARNGEALRLFDPVRTLPGQLALSEGAPDAQ